MGTQPIMIRTTCSRQEIRMWGYSLWEVQYTGFGDWLGTGHRRRGIGECVHTYKWSKHLSEVFIFSILLTSYLSIFIQKHLVCAPPHQGKVESTCSCGHGHNTLPDVLLDLHFVLFCPNCWEVGPCRLRFLTQVGTAKTGNDGNNWKARSLSLSQAVSNSGCVCLRSCSFLDTWAFASTFPPLILAGASGNSTCLFCSSIHLQVIPYYPLFGFTVLLSFQKIFLWVQFPPHVYLHFITYSSWKSLNSEMNSFQLLSRDKYNKTQTPFSPHMVSLADLSIVDLGTSVFLWCVMDCSKNKVALLAGEIWF